ncbi:hypothetical protein BJ875DRAFT_442748 [Amylocarpus encephaloides]|uniref:Phosphoribosyltransferase domain-containing protein n=1 Tax=Amylocarpus encephaloides TaxID=45428 RepID=A0A9P7YFD8_9HELO|nr:hypothetical protein BJ875DRAFT_442748 [Amylocarpus encephaloides]
MLDTQLQCLAPDGQIKNLKTVIVMDADKTLATESTGSQLWEIVDNRKSDPGTDSEEGTLKRIFGTKMEYSYIAFKQAVLRYEEADVFEETCQLVADKISVYEDVKKMLCIDTKGGDIIPAFVFTSGNRRVWEIVIEKYQLAHRVKVIGSNRIADNFVLTHLVKEALVKHLETTHNIYVWAFGGCHVDLGMLKMASQAVVVVGEDGMKEHLIPAISRGLYARQLLPTSSTKPLKFGKSGAKVPNVQKGVDKVPTQGVQNMSTDGWRLQDEGKTLIMALLRGGESMAMGIHDALPKAMFRHARDDDKAKENMFNGGTTSTVVLVASEISTGMRVMEAAAKIRDRQAFVRIVIVAGVIYENFTSEKNYRILSGMGDISMIALRCSPNKYIGRGKMNTADRLYGTTHIKEKI